jgi:hypothetical protein
MPRAENGARAVELHASELAMILDGINVSKLKRVARYERAVGSSKCSERNRLREDVARCPECEREVSAFTSAFPTGPSPSAMRPPIHGYFAVGGRYLMNHFVASDWELTSAAPPGLKA